jgi:hypothetical protein
MFEVLSSISNVWVGNDLSSLVFPIQEPQFALGHQRQNDFMQLFHLSAFLFWLRCYICFDLFLYAHANLPGYRSAQVESELTITGEARFQNSGVSKQRLADYAEIDTTGPSDRRPGIVML